LRNISEITLWFVSVRNYHASVCLLSWRGRREEALGLKTPGRERKVKRENKSQAPPVESRYLPPKPKQRTKPTQVKTVEIFEGMTIVELAKRTGSSVRTLQEILTSVGEKVRSEFDPITIDVAELVSTVSA
jgi:translation initiation factor IF-2